VALADGKPSVLVKERIADSGVALLREDFDVELGLDMSEAELNERIADFDAIVVRSATKVTADLIGRAERMKVIGRAGTGVDNVDVDAATKRGIVVVNAPESNSVAAAEHTLALALALSRNIPRANASLANGEWARSRFAGNELYGKTLGVIGFGRIGQLVAKRAQALEAALDSGKVGGAALDVFPTEPFTEHPLFGRDNVVVTPHLGASTAEAQDRAGTITADQVRRALSGGVVTNAVNIAAVRPEEMEALAPFVPLCERLGRLAQGLGDASVGRITAEFRGRIAEHDTRLLGIAVLVGILSGHTEEQVNLVNAPALAEERGIELTELKDVLSEEFTELVTVRLGADEDAVEVSGTAVGPRSLPHLVRAWGESFYMPFADHLVVFRYKDQPGMIGRVGTIFGTRGVNIASAAVGAESSGGEAVLALTTDAPVPEELLEEILRLDGFHAGRAVDF
jgi:phosphoglycerate dehydrogenase-like enzyme